MDFAVHERPLNRFDIRLPSTFRLDSVSGFWTRILYFTDIRRRGLR
jgi:hypothetical protein